MKGMTKEGGDKAWDVSGGVKSRPLRYGFAVLASLAAVPLTSWTAPLVGHHTAFYEFFHIAILLSAFYGGPGPGVLAATLSFFLLDYYYIPPIKGFALNGHFFRLGLFEALALVTSFLSGRLRRVKHEAVEKAVLEVSAREQRRLGHDLHDGLCQTLAGVRLMVEDLIEKRGPDARDEELEQVQRRLTEALDEAYNVSRGLYPVELETNGLMSALEELADNTSRRHPVACRFECPQPVTARDNEAATHLYRIAQEAVVNAIKGGKAGRILMSLEDKGDSGLLIVADNGGGLGNGPSRKGLGMKIMEYRAQVVGAVLDFRSPQEGGTVVTCSFPKADSPEARHGG